MKYYYLIKDRIMSSNEKMPAEPCYKVIWDEEGDEILNDWKNSLQPCEISESELLKLNAIIFIFFRVEILKLDIYI